MNERQLERLDHLQVHARSLGGACLSKKYGKCTDRLRWRCAEGHEWVAMADSIRQGKWCAICSHAAASAERRARTFARVQAIALEKGGRCLSTEYVNAYTHLRWRCGEGHEWEAPPTMIGRGKWCPTCAGAARWVDVKAEVFARIQAIAREKGGRCLSTEYVNADAHLRWRCAEGHEWEATPSCISHGTWCARCARKAKLTIEEMQELARARGGLCVSTEYANSKTRLRWRCAVGHEWSALQSHVRRGAWCPHCAGNAPRTIREVQAMAAERGGICLSTTIKSSSDRVRFRCRVGHEFARVVQHLHQGIWCPRCRLAPVGTLRRLRQVIEGRGGVLLDNEYQGSQTLVRVRCKEGHEWNVAPTGLLGGSWCRACWVVESRGRPKPRLSIVDMQEVAQSRGGRCLSDTYVNAVTRLRWQCHDGHEWDAIPASVRSGHWCSICARRHCGSIDGMRALAAERGGKCRSRVYHSSKDVLRFTCAKGHEFTATGTAVKSGAWCLECGEWDPPARKRPRRERANTKR